MRKIISFCIIAIVVLALVFTIYSDKHNTTTEGNQIILNMSDRQLLDSILEVKLNDSISKAIFAESILMTINKTYNLLLKSNSNMIWQDGNALGTKMVRIDNKLYRYYINPQGQFNTSTLCFQTESLTKDGFPRERCIFEYNHSNNTFSIDNHFYQKAGQPTGKTTNLALLKKRLMFFVSKMEQINRSL